MVAAIARSLAWDDFRLINAIADTGALPAAASRLGLDHSTVFRRLRQIETALGTAVFERHRSGYVPTTAGTEIAALAARFDEDITVVLRRVAGQSPDPTGEVRVATSDALLFDLLMPLFAAFQKTCPNVRLDLVTSNRALNLSRRDADVAIRATTAPPDTLVGRKSARIAWAAYSTTALSQGLVEEAALAGLETSWVGFGDALDGLGATDYLQSRVHASKVGCRLDTIAGIAAAVEAGLGAGLLPCFVGDSRPTLMRVTAPLASLTTDLWLLTHADLRNVPRVRILLDFLGEHLRELRDVIEGKTGFH